jgi:hypothetical protein
MSTAVSLSPFHELRYLIRGPARARIFAGRSECRWEAIARGDAIAIFRGKRTIFDLTRRLETASCRPCCLNHWQLWKLQCKEASDTFFGRSAI